MQSSCLSLPWAQPYCYWAVGCHCREDRVIFTVALLQTRVRVHTHMHMLTLSINTLNLCIQNVVRLWVIHYRFLWFSTMFHPLFPKHNIQDPHLMQLHIYCIIQSYISARYSYILISCITHLQLVLTTTQPHTQPTHTHRHNAQLVHQVHNIILVILVILVMNYASTWNWIVILHLAVEWKWCSVHKYQEKSPSKSTH